MSPETYACVTDEQHTQTISSIFDSHLFIKLIAAEYFWTK